MDEPLSGLSPLVERAHRVAVIAHRSQHRKATTIPYIMHPFAVALILQRHGWTEDHVIIAAILHDVVEDTDCSEADLGDQFPSEIMLLVHALSGIASCGDTVFVRSLSLTLPVDRTAELGSVSLEWLYAARRIVVESVAAGRSTRAWIFPEIGCEVNTPSWRSIRIGTVEEVYNMVDLTHA